MTAIGLSLPRSEIALSGMTLLSPRSTFGPYATPYWLFVWLMSGRGSVTSDGRTWPLVPGSVHLSPPGVTSFWQWDPEHTIREGNVQFISEGSPDWPRQRTFPPNHVVPVLLEHILWLSGERPDGWEEAREEALRYVLRAYVQGYSGSSPSDRIPLSEPVARVVALVQQSWLQLPIRVHSLDELAAAAGVTKSHLCRLFEQEAGTGPVGAFRMLRLERAATLLDQTNMSVINIARAVGYGSEFHFSRIFRSVTGLSPSAFRADPQARFELPPQLRDLSNRLWRQLRDNQSGLREIAPSAAGSGDVQGGSSPGGRVV